MTQSGPISGHLIRFGVFELDPRSGELRRNGSRVRLQEQPVQILLALLENPGRMVSREDLRRRIWPSDTFVDFDRGLYSGLARLRDALGDSAENPRFIETIPRRGYCFIAPVELPTCDSAQPAHHVKPVLVPGKKARGPIILALASVALLAICLILALALSSRLPQNWRLTLATPSVPSLTKLATLTPVPFSVLSGKQSGPTFSPDGSHVAFAWDGDSALASSGLDLYAKAIGSETVLRLTQHPSSCLDAAWSPDGTQVAFHRISRSDGGIYIVPALGGAERKLRATHMPLSLKCYTAISWSRDGKSIAFVDSLPTGEGYGIRLLSVETLESKLIAHAAGCQAELFPAYSPDGNQLAYICFHGGQQFGIYTVLPSGEQPKLISKFLGSPFGIAWTADNRRLIVSHLNRNADLDEVTVADGSIRKLPFGDSRWPTISRTGDKLGYIATSDNINIWRKDLLHPEAAAVKLLSSTREQTYPQYSPDGNHIAFMSSRTGNMEIWISDADGTHLVQISNLRYPITGSPHWSPDGTKIAFDSRESGHGEVYSVDISDRIPQRLVTNLAENSVPSWSRDGKWIYFVSQEDEVTGPRIFRCPAVGGDAVAVTARPANFANLPIESYDGRTVYFTASGNGAMAIMYTVSVNDPRTESVLREMPPHKGPVLWTMAPGGIYFVPADAPRSVRYFDFAAKNVRQVFEIDKDFSYGLSVSPDGRWILYSQIDDLKSEIMLVDHFR